MRKTIFLIGASFAVLASLSSCQTGVDVESLYSQAPEIIATLETEDNTKSMISVDGEGVGTIYWTPADRINIFYGTTSTLYTSQNTENALTAVFRTTDIIGSTESASDNIWGLYPYDEDAVCDGNTVTTTIPSTQYAVPDTFDDDLFPTLAHSETNALKFYNVCGGIKFSLSRNDITRITFRGNNSENLAGRVNLSFTDNRPAASVLSGAKEITLLPKTGETFAQNTNYYLVLLPGTLSGGFTMTFLTSDGSTGTFNYTTSAVTIKRSVFSRKANIDSYATFIPQGNIVFEDANFKAYCVTNFDTDGDGEVSYDEASIVTAIRCSNNNITSTEGIQYFPALERLECFFNQLASLDVSSNKALKYLHCGSNNQLTELDVSGSTALEYLDCTNCNTLTALDVSGCIALSQLFCYSSSLSSLDASGCTALVYLQCYSNQLTSLNVSGCTSLEHLRCDSNQLTSLNVSDCTSLSAFGCQSNQLTGLDISNCTSLSDLSCFSNQITSLDVSGCTTLEYLRCQSNQLTTLDVCNNTALKYLSCWNNPYLTEIWLKTGQTISNFSYDTDVATIYYK